MGHRSHWLFVALTVVFLAATARASGTDAEATLEASGLRKLSTNFAVPEESELTKSIRDAESLKRELFDAQKRAGECKKKIEDKRNLILGYLQKRRELRTQLTTVRTLEAHNQIVLTLNELGDRIVLLHESKQDEEALKSAMAEVNRLTEEYIESLLKARQLYDQVIERYKQLSADPAVRQAVGEYNKTSERTYSLGPSSSFLSNGRRLARLEESVLSDSVPLRRGAGDLWHLNVVFNGKKATDMAIDTGASIIALPWRTAQELGLKPTEDDQPIQLQMADGRVVEGKLVMAEKIRVGRFTVENVECAVMPAELAEAYPFLGLNFFKHFTFKIDNQEGKLILARVEDSEAGSRPRPVRK
jgi:aspartyl protease family protein